MNKFYVNLNPYYFKQSFSSEKLKTELFHSAMLRYVFYFFKNQRQSITMSNMLSFEKQEKLAKRDNIKKIIY